MKKECVDVLLVTPLAIGEQSFSVGILNISSILEEEGISNSIVDFNYLFSKSSVDFTAEACAEYIDAIDSRLVAFGCMSNCYSFYLNIAEILKSRRIDRKVVFGGPQATATGMKTMETFPFIDMVILGEAEITVADNFKYLLGMSNRSSLKNAIYRYYGGIASSDSVPLIENLDILPLLDYSKLQNWHEVEKVVIEVGRGCPFDCIFCSTKTFWQRKPRLKSVDRLITEIERIVALYGKSNFTMIHDLFTFDNDYVLRFCNELISKGLTISWSCSSRIDTICNDMIGLMHKAGCNRIFFGIEVGSDIMQRKINKKLDLSKLEPLLKCLVQYDFDNITFSFMYNFPDESEDSVKSTVGLLLHILHEYDFNVQIAQCCILPGTKLYEINKMRLTLAPIENTMTLSLPMDRKSNQRIMKFPDIFSQYYIVDSDVFRKYLLLESFVAFYTSFYKLYRGACSVVMNFFNNDFFAFYGAFSSENARWLLDNYTTETYVVDKYMLCEHAQHEKGFAILEHVGGWVGAHMQCCDLLFLKDTIEYYRCILDIHMNQSVDTHFFSFNNDVVGLSKGCDYYECLGQKIKVIISRRPNNSVSIKRKRL